MKSVFIAGLFAFGVTLAIVVGYRLAGESINPIAWMAAGCIVSVPLAFGLARVLRRMRGRQP